MTNRTQIHELYKKDKYVGHKSQNFSSVSPKLHQPGQKTQGHECDYHFSL